MNERHLSISIDNGRHHSEILSFALPKRPTRDRMVCLEYHSDHTNDVISDGIAFEGL